MSLNQNDVIYIHRFKDENIDFYCYKHFNDLIGLPTRVFLIRNGTIYVTHPTLDVVPLSENCVDYEVLKDIDVGYHHQLKNKLQTLKTHGVKKIPKERLTKLFKPKLKEQEEPKKSKIDDNLIRTIEMLQSGDVQPSFLDNMFGGLDKFLSMLKNRGLMDRIDPFDSVYSDMENELFYSFIKTDPSFVWRIVDTLLSDVTKIGDDYYFDTSSEELSGYFYEGRNDVSQGAIASILDGDYDRWYDDITDDEYRDIYEELNIKNKNKVLNRLKQELKDAGEISFDYKYPELFDEIAKEQGLENKFNIIDDSVIVRLLQDDDCRRYLINREFDDFRSELYQLYVMCYTDTLSDEWHESIMSELVGFVIDDPVGEEYSYKGYGWDKDGKRITKTVFAKRYKATNAIFNNVKLWIESNYKYSDTISYFGNYNDLIGDMLHDGELNYLRVRLDDYPDHRKVSQCLDDNIDSYI